MTQKERIEMLAKLFWEYKKDLNKIDVEGHEIVEKLNANESDANIMQLKLLNRERGHLENTFVNPTIKLLYYEGVKLMKMEDGKLKLLMKDDSEIVIDIDDSNSKGGRNLRKTGRKKNKKWLH